MSHDTGKSDFRIITPTRYTSGIVTIEMSASGTSIDSMNPNATSAIEHCTRMSGANVMYSCTERMSEFAREISCPDCTRS